MALDAAAWGNSVIVELLETYLQHAKDKPFGFVGIVMLGHSNKPVVAISSESKVLVSQTVAAVDWAGAPALEEPSLEAVDRLKARIQSHVASWKLPPPNPALDHSYVVWNLAHGPLGFDFMTWLINAEMVRVRSGAPAPLKVGFWLGTDPLNSLRKDNRETWFGKVFRPAVEMIGAVEDPEFGIFGHDIQVFTPKPIAEACRAGEQVPRFKSGLPPRRPGCVTITLREAAHWQVRNSRLAHWVRFAGYLQERGEDVVIVRDTAKAHEPLDMTNAELFVSTKFAGDIPTDPEASIDLTVRASLYEGAKCNLSDGGGPWQICLYGDRPWLAFIPIEEDEADYQPNTRLFWKNHQGIEAGSQFPWSSDMQRIVWLPGTYDNIVSAWERLGLSNQRNMRYGT